MDKHQIPIDMVEPDQLPRENPIKFEEVCRIIGELYFRAHHQETTQSEQFKVIVEQLKERINRQTEEIGRLKAEISRYEREAEGRNSKSHHSGKDKS